MKKPLTVVLGSCLLAGTAWAGYQQMQYEKQVEASVRQWVERIDGTWIDQHPLWASYDQHQGALFESRGSVSLILGESDKPTQFKLEYRVEHPLYTLLSGATFHLSVDNIMLAGDSEHTLNRVLFGGQSITVEGQVHHRRAEGVTRIPAIRISNAKRQTTLSSSPSTLDWTLTQGADGIQVDDFNARYLLPEIRLDSEQSELRQLNLDQLDGQFSYQLSGDRETSSLDWSMASLSLKNRLQQITLDGLKLQSSWTLAEQASSSTRLSVDQANLQGVKVEQAELELTLDGLNGEAVRALQQVSQQAQREHWSPERMQQALRDTALERSGQLLQDDPTLTLNRLDLDLGQEGRASLQGAVALDHTRLSMENLQALLSRQGGNQQQLQQELRQALKMHLQVQSNGQPQAYISTLLMMAAPQLVPHLQEGSLALEMTDGQARVNGQPLL